MMDEVDVSRQQKIWLKRIAEEQKAHKEFRDRSEEVEEVFRGGEDGDQMVPLYWSVVGVEHVGVYSNQPSPDVRPRNELANPLYKSVARLINRGLAYCTDHHSFDDSMHRSVDDFLAMGLGTLRVKVDSEIEEVTQQVPIMGQDPMGMPIQVGMRDETEEVVKEQTIRWEYVPWRRFGWQPCNHFKQCDWIYFRHCMTQVQIKKRFGRTVKASEEERKNTNYGDYKNKAYDIYEIWDKEKRQVLFIANGESEPLEVNEDPLELLDFWPVPGLMMTNIGSEELIPKADYDYIESYDRELNRLQERRAQVLEQIKAAGAYDQGMEELGDILDLDDGEMKPVVNLVQRLTAAGGKDFMWFVPIQEKLEALKTLTEQIAFVKSQVDEILGISDIVRGVTAASETAAAQEIKGRWVGVRLTRKREIVMYTVKGMMRIMAQLLASHVIPENLSRMTQMEITQEMVDILQDDMMMDFIIDIETDSTVAKDEFKERKVHQEMLNGVAQFAQSVMPLVQANTLPADTASAILASALRPYAHVDRSLSEALNQLPDSQKQLQELQQQMQQLTQERDQANEGLQYWQGMATQLQNMSTEASTAQKQADAEKKRAEKLKIEAQIPDNIIQADHTVAQIGESEARAEESRARADLMKRTPTNNANGSGR